MSEPAPATPEFPKMDEAMRVHLADLDRRWSLHPFSSGWRIVDIVVRVIVIFVLVWVTISLNSQLEAARATGHRHLDTHQQALGQQDVVTLRKNYSDLLAKTSEMFEAEIADRKMHIAALLGFIALLAVSALGSWRTHKELVKLRSGFQFLFTYEGRQVLDRVAPKQGAP